MGKQNKKTAVRCAYIVMLILTILVLTFMLYFNCLHRKNAEDAKNAFLASHIYDEYFNVISDIRYEEIYLTSNNHVPALIMCEGDFHAANICLFLYNEEKNTYELSGVFSEYGRLQYAPKKGLILSMYGGMGTFFWLEHRFINSGEWELVDSVAEVERSAKKTYYAQFPVPTSIVDPRVQKNDEDLDWTFIAEKYQVSESEYMQRQIGAGEEYITVTYENMKPILQN